MDQIHNLLGSEETKLVWILPTILCIVLASAVYTSHNNLKSIDNEDQEARALRTKTRGKCAMGPFASSDENGGEGKKEEKGVSKDDAWEERRRRGIIPSSSSASSASHTKANSGKPFQSSYYYAHNSVSAKGGYSDGLSMEDFTMNGPRLLSKGGNPVAPAKQEEPQAVVSGNSSRNDAPETTNSSSGCDTKFKDSATKSLCLPITKYLWDDPGDSTGIACIRVDTLVSPANKSLMITWAEADIVEASAELVNNSKGLLVVARSAAAVEYRLEIKQLYGSVASANVLTSKMKKRLIIQLRKTKGFWDRSNMNAWPQPHQKV